jgi:hypothetical protein
MKEALKQSTKEWGEAARRYRATSVYPSESQYKGKAID